MKTELIKLLIPVSRKVMLTYDGITVSGKAEYFNSDGTFSQIPMSEDYLICVTDAYDRKLLISPEHISCIVLV